MAQDTYPLWRTWWIIKIQILIFKIQIPIFKIQISTFKFQKLEFNIEIFKFKLEFELDLEFGSIGPSEVRATSGQHLGGHYFR